MTPDHDLALIARKLSPAEREALFALPEDGSAMVFVGDETPLYMMSDVRTGDAEQSVERHAALCKRFYHSRLDYWGRALWAITPVGREVRDWLRRQETPP